MAKKSTKASRRQGMRELRAADKQYVRKLDRMAVEQDAEEHRAARRLARRRKRKT